MAKDLIDLGLPQAFLEKVERLPATLQDELDASGNSGNPGVVVQSQYSFSEAFETSELRADPVENIPRDVMHNGSIQVLDYEQEESLNFEEIDDSVRSRGTDHKLYMV